MPALEPIPSTAAGWPYLPDSAPVADVAAYAQLLAARLAGFTPGSGAAVGDTGWTAVANVAGFTGAGQVRVIGTVAYLRGTISGTVSANTNTKIATIPAGCRPAQIAVRACREATTATDAGIWADTDGSIWVRKGAATGAASFDIGTLSAYLTT